MIGKWNRSVILTYIGLTASIIGMLLCMTDANNIKISFVLLMVAGVCDLFDGSIARKCKRTEEEKAFGIEIDSIVDVMSFIAFPIVLLSALGLNQWYNYIIFAIFAICGVARLGYFNIATANPSKAIKHYIGLPVTYVAMIYPLLYLLKLCLAEDVMHWILTISSLIISILFVLKVKIIKPKGVAYLIFALLAIIMIIVYCVFM